MRKYHDNSRFISCGRKMSKTSWVLPPKLWWAAWTTIDSRTGHPLVLRHCNLHWIYTSLWTTIDIREEVCFSDTKLWITPWHIGAQEGFSHRGQGGNGPSSHVKKQVVRCTTKKWRMNWRSKGPVPATSQIMLEDVHVFTDICSRPKATRWSLQSLVGLRMPFHVDGPASCVWQWHQRLSTKLCPWHDPPSDI